MDAVLSFTACWKKERAQVDIALSCSVRDLRERVAGLFGLDLASLKLMGLAKGKLLGDDVVLGELPKCQKLLAKARKGKSPGGKLPRLMVVGNPAASLDFSEQEHKLLQRHLAWVRREREARDYELWCKVQDAEIELLYTRVRRAGRGVKERSRKGTHRKLLQAIMDGNEGMVRTMLGRYDQYPAAGAGEDAHLREEAVMKAAMLDQVSVLEALDQREGFPTDSLQALALAVYFGRTDAAQFLVDRGAPPMNRAEPWHIAAIAAQRGHKSTLAYLMRVGAEIDDTVFIHACVGGYVHTAKFVAKHRMRALQAAHERRIGTPGQKEVYFRQRRRLLSRGLIVAAAFLNVDVMYYFLDELRELYGAESGGKVSLSYKYNEPDPLLQASDHGADVDAFLAEQEAEQEKEQPRALPQPAGAGAAGGYELLGQMLDQDLDMAGPDVMQALAQVQPGTHANPMVQQLHEQVAAMINAGMPDEGADADDGDAPDLAAPAAGAAAPAAAPAAAAAAAPMPPPAPLPALPVDPVFDQQDFNFIYTPPLTIEALEGQALGAYMPAFLGGHALGMGGGAMQGLGGLPQRFPHGRFPGEQSMAQLQGHSVLSVLSGTLYAAAPGHFTTPRVLECLRAMLAMDDSDVAPRLFFRAAMHNSEVLALLLQVCPDKLQPEDVVGWGQVAQDKLREAVNKQLSIEALANRTSQLLADDDMLALRYPQDLAFLIVDYLYGASGRHVSRIREQADRLLRDVGGLSGRE